MKFKIKTGPRRAISVAEENAFEDTASKICKWFIIILVITWCAGKWYLQ